MKCSKPLVSIFGSKFSFYEPPYINLTCSFNISDLWLRFSKIALHLFSSKFKDNPHIYVFIC